MNSLNIRYNKIVFIQPTRRKAARHMTELVSSQEEAIANVRFIYY